MFRKKTRDEQPSMWLAVDEIVSTPDKEFYERLSAELDELGFGDAIRALCEPYYEQDRSKGGRPGTDPEVYFKMLMIGMFENIPSGRAIAAQCADSQSKRAFLRYEWTERTPDHRTLSFITKRLPGSVFRAVFDLMLASLRTVGLATGKHIAIDSSDIEAHASMKSIRHRTSKEDYMSYVRTLAEEAGVEVKDDADVRRYDRNRPGRTTSNTEWEHAHDPEAKIGRTKRGTTRMIYKAEHVVDSRSGALLDVDIQPGDAHDATGLAERIDHIEESMNRAFGYDREHATIGTITADRGYYSTDGIIELESDRYRTNIPRPSGRSNWSKLHEDEAKLLRRALNRTKTRAGKRKTRLRGEMLERTFAHVLDQGGGRRSTVRGREAILKRHLIRAMTFNASLLMRTKFGIGTPKQAIDRLFDLISNLHATVRWLWCTVITAVTLRRA